MSPTTEVVEFQTAPAVMKFASLRIQNFRGLKDVLLPLSEFGCLIGENNSGKSSALQALLLLLPGSGLKASVDDFYDIHSPIRIALRIEGISDPDLALVAEAHRQSIAKDVVDGSMTLVRAVVFEGGSVQSSLLVERLGPANEKWLLENLQPMMTKKQDAELRASVVAAIPELDAELPAKPTQAIIKQKLSDLIAALPNEDLVARDEPIGTGIENGLKGFLPEPIYIEAVKDVADEVKTSDSATFGKLLGILLEEVKDQFGDIEQRFQAIQRQLSRVSDAATGAVVDDRLDEVKFIEEVINGFVRESFPDVDLKIEVPVPKMKTILAGATITADDGHEGPVVGKGDGLKRAVAFAILRAYTTLRGKGFKADSEGEGGPRYWLLFEEPELYLYPRAQRQLFRALEIFALRHLVLVTTHSPMFFDADTTRTFVKFRKNRSTDDSAPFTEIDPVLVESLPLKTAFQIICHENNNIGFFARKVVLVEGDSDAIILSHLARLLGGKDWDVIEQNVAFAKVGGKGNIASYRLFFEKFRIPVHIVTDLDTVINGFGKLNPSTSAVALRGTLLSEVDNILASESPTEVTETAAKSMIGSGNARSLWRDVERARDGLDGTDAAHEALARAVHEFFAYKRKDERLEALTGGLGNVGKVKRELFAELAEGRVYVLSRGTVESYYGSKFASSDKVKDAIDYVAGCETLETLRTDLGGEAKEVETELREIFSAIFDSPDW